MGSALLITLALIATFTASVPVEEGEILQIDVNDKFVLTGAIIGALLPFIFAALTMFAVGSAAEELIVEVRRQFREIPYLREGKTPDGKRVNADHATCINICTTAALREMVMPGVLAVFTPVAFGFTFGAKFIGGLLVGSILSGFFLGITMANAGGAWDNAKKYVEANRLIYQGKVQSKKSDYHVATVVGDTVGDPFKDTSGPALNILAKLMSLLSLIISGALSQEMENYKVGLIFFAVGALVAIIVFIVSKIRASQKAIITFTDLPFTDPALDDKLAFQAKLIADLIKVTGIPSGTETDGKPDAALFAARQRFVIDEVYANNDKRAEVTLKIVYGPGGSSRSLYEKLMTQTTLVGTAVKLAEQYDVEQVKKEFAASRKQAKQTQTYTVTMTNELADKLGKLEGFDIQAAEAAEEPQAANGKGQEGDAAPTLLEKVEAVVTEAVAPAAGGLTTIHTSSGN
jgi:hypothetical protein